MKVILKSRVANRFHPTCPPSFYIRQIKNQQLSIFLQSRGLPNYIIYRIELHRLFRILIQKIEKFLFLFSRTNYIKSFFLKSSADREIFYTENGRGQEFTNFNDIPGSLLSVKTGRSLLRVGIR